MPGDEGLSYNETAHEASAISRYTAFLALQSRAYAMSDQEYLAELDALLKDGGVPEGEGRYAEGEADLDGIDPAVIEAIQSDEEYDINGERRVLQFEQYAGTIDQQLGRERDGDRTLDIRYEGEEPEEGSEPEEEPAELEEKGVEPEDDDATLDIQYEGDPEEAAALEESGEVLENDDGTLDIQYEGTDGTELDADGNPIKEGLDPEDDVDGTEPEDDAEDAIQGAYVQVEAEPEEPEAEPEPEYNLSGKQPEQGGPGVTGATLLDDEDEYELQGGGMHVTEEFEVNDWLDTLAAGTGLLQGVQTAEYIPPVEVQKAPDAKQPQLQKTELMQQLDRKIARDFAPEGQKQAGLDGPNK